MTARVDGLRLALFSGNYNYVKDGANQALNRLVGRLLERGAAVRVYSPTSGTPAFAPVGDLVSVPSVPFPGRGEYRVGLGLNARVRTDLATFAPNIVHLSAPDLLGNAAKKWGRAAGLPVTASVHTRFETYFGYYGLGFVRRWAEESQKRFYRDLDAVWAPSESMADVLRAEGWAPHVGIWSRGVDRAQFHPGRRSLAWRRALGIADGEFVLGFVGRLVLEKGLDVLAAVGEGLRAAGVPHRVLVVGDGPARGWIAQRLPGGVFPGFLTGEALARAYASMDVMLNPSVTETFGNVTLEAMACAVPVVAADATGSASLVADRETGRLIAPGDLDGFVAAVAAYQRDVDLRARAGAAALARARTYDWDAINDAVIDRYPVLVAGALRAAA